MTQREIRAKLPHTVHVLYDLNKNTVSIEHDGGPVNEVIPGCKKTLEWCVKGADLLFKSGADNVELHFRDIPTNRINQRYLVAAYRKTDDFATNSQGFSKRDITYACSSYDSGELCDSLGEARFKDIAVDAKLVKACMQRVAEKEEQK